MSSAGALSQCLLPYTRHSMWSLESDPGAPSLRTLRRIQTLARALLAGGAAADTPALRRAVERAATHYVRNLTVAGAPRPRREWRA
jgi:hypothetical protein